MQDLLLNYKKKQLLESVAQIAKFIDHHSQVELSQLRSHFSEANWPENRPVQDPEKLQYSVNALPHLPSAPNALGFNHVALVCTDMATTVRFYSGILGFKLVKTLQLGDGGQHFFFDCGNVQGGTLAFFWWPDSQPRANGVASASRAQMESGMIPRSAPGSVNHIAFSYPESGLMKMRKRLQKAGVWVSPLVYHAENDVGISFSRDDPDLSVISMYFWGPDGELIEFSSVTPKMYPPDVKERVQHEPAIIPVCKL